VTDEKPDILDIPATPHTAATPPRNRLVYALDIALVRLRFIGLLVAVMLVAAYWDDVIEYFCPMHPHIVRPEPGSCPICGMPLSKRKKGGKETLPEGVLARVQFSPFRVAQGGIRTSPVEWRPLEREIETVGSVEFDERRLARITARFPGRIESLAVDFTGISVERGKALATIYSPELLAAQESLLSAARGLRDAESASPPDQRTIERSRSLAEAARSRLRLWGLWPEQIEAVERAGKASPTIDVLAPLSGVVTKKAVVVGDYVAEGAALFDVADLTDVWIKARVYEADLGAVAVGQKVAAQSSAYPGEIFEGAIAFVDPILDRATRTAGLRADLPNPQGRLKPGMYVTVVVRMPLADVEPFRSMPRPVADGEPAKPRVEYWCPMHPEVAQPAPGKCDECGGMELIRREVPAGPAPNDVLAVPETAVVDTGRRKVVYVESSAGVFDAHEVVLGPRAGIYYPVVKGLAPGMRVATAGSFLIDAETRLNPAAAGTYFGSQGTAPGHEGHEK
jgi:Cu(I)/Ag(I) efflux system membrane fusion protein